MKSYWSQIRPCPYNAFTSPVSRVHVMTKFSGSAEQTHYVGKVENKSRSQIRLVVAF